MCDNVGVTSNLIVIEVKFFYIAFILSVAKLHILYFCKILKLKNKHFHLYESKLVIYVEQFVTDNVARFG